MPDDDPLDPQQRLSKRNLLGDALKTFMFSLSQGMAASAAMPGRRGSRAGVAAALGAPLILQQMDEQRSAEAEDRAMKMQQFRQQMATADQQKKMQLIQLLTGRATPANGVMGEAPMMGSPDGMIQQQGPPAFQPGDDPMALANRVAPPNPMSGPNQTPTFAPNPTINVGGVGFTPPNRAEEDARKAAEQAALDAQFERRQVITQKAQRDFAPPAAPILRDIPGRGTVQIGPNGARFIPGTEPLKPEVKPTHVSSYTNKQGKHIDVFMGADGKTTEVVGEDVQPRPTGGAGGVGTLNAVRGDIADTADGIINGTLPPPDLGSRPTQFSMALTGELKRKGFDLSTARRDWVAIQRHLSSLNSVQQERLRQAVEFSYETLPQIEEAYAEWKKQAGISGFKLINRGTLAATSHLPGPAGSAASQLEALMKDFTSELGTVYKGGNASTDESLKLAAENLKGEWNEKTFGDAISRIRTSLQIRKNSILTSQPVGVSSTSPYLPPTAGATAAPKATGRYNPKTGKIEPIP